MHKNSAILGALVLMVFVVSSLAVAGDNTGSKRFLVCNTQAVASKKDVKPYIDGFGGYLAKKLGWEEGSYGVRFEGKRAAGIAAMTQWNPGFASVSLGLFLEARNSLPWKPLVVARMNGSVSTKYRILVKKGSGATLDLLKGKTLSGNIMDDGLFLSKVIFAGAVDAESYFQLDNTKRPLRSIRKLARGKIDAVLVDELQYSSLKELPMFSDLEVAWESQSIPNLAMVYRPGVVSEKEAKAFGQALIDMCTDSEGKKLCQTFGLEGFAFADDAAMKTVIGLYETK